MGQSNARMKRPPAARCQLGLQTCWKSTTSSCARDECKRKEYGILHFKPMMSDTTLKDLDDHTKIQRKQPGAVDLKFR